MTQQSILPYLVETALRARTTAGKDGAGVGRGKVANAGNLSQDTVRRFEEEISWKRETDKLVRAYAKVSGRPVEALWYEALERMISDRAPDGGAGTARALREIRFGDPPREEAPGRGEGAPREQRRRGGERRRKPSS